MKSGYKLILFFTLALSFLFLSSSPCWADTYFVPDDYSTIQAAVDAISSGDTVIVRDGTYYEQVQISKSNVTLQAKNDGGAVLQGPSNGFSISNSQNLTIEGFKFSRNNTGIHIQGSQFVEVNSCQFENNTSQGIRVCCTDRSSDLTFRGNRFIDDNQGPDSNMDYGLQLYWSDRITVTDNYFGGVRSAFNQALSLKTGVNDAYIANNTFENFRWSAVYVGQEDPGHDYYEICSNNVVENNTFRRAGAGERSWDAIVVRSAENTVVRDNFIEDVQSAGVYVYGSTGRNVEIYRNTVINGSTGILIDRPDGDSLVYNNTIYNMNVGLLSNQSGNGIKNNIFANNATQFYGNLDSQDNSHNNWFPSQPSGAGLGSISGDPQFVNPGGGNFRLQPGSPCIDVGADVGLSYQGSAPDMGVYESAGGGPTPTTISDPTPTPTSTPPSITFKELLENWGAGFTNPDTDLNGDGLVNGLDFGEIVNLLQASN